MEEYLGVKEFAERVQKSEQSVYKRLRNKNDKIQQYVKLKDGKKVIAAAAIENLYYNDCIEYEEIKEEKPFQENEIIKILKEQIEQQQKEIEFKNKQLDDLTEQLKASSERETNYQTLLNQQQQLTAAEKQKVLLLEDNQKKCFFGIFKRKGKVKE